jgi:hypothetical protein
VSPCRGRRNSRSRHLPSADLFSWVNDCLHAEMFVSYAMFSFGANHDSHACRGIGRKYCPAFETLNLGRLRWDSTAAGGGFAGKQEFEVFSRAWSWMFSSIS